MGKALTLARRELAGYFLSPVAYIIGSLFLLVSGVLFFFGFTLLDIREVFSPGNESSLRQLFEDLAYIMVFVGPLLTMRLLSEEFRSGTIETLMTSPVSDAQVIMGKFLGVMSFYLALLAGTLVFLALIVMYGQPDAGVAAMGYLGMILLGAAFISVGVFTSTLTRHQLVAAILGIAVLAFFSMFMQVIVKHAPEPWNAMAGLFNAMTYFKEFSRGVFDTRAAAFFVTTAGLFLFLSVKTLESKRWR